MNIKEFAQTVYPENIEGTAEWFYGSADTGLEAADLLHMREDYVYEGSRLFFIHLSGELFEPIKQEQNVFLSAPVYHTDDNAFAVIKYDFNKRIMQMLKYEPGADRCSVLGEIPLSKGGDLINISILPNSYILVKYEAMRDSAAFLYPFEKEIQLEENESIHCVNGSRLIDWKWIEDPDYREEIIIRNLETAEITERKNGFVRTMPNGELWLLSADEYESLR